MKHCILIILCVVFINIPDIFSQYINPGGWPLITTPRISLKNVDHNGEGFVVTLSNGTLLNIFRLDPGFSGNHIGNNAKIVQRYSYDNGDSWTVPQGIYNSPVDDRNIHGGITEDNRIICTFRRYNATAYAHIDYNLIYSDDNGSTWSAPVTIPTSGVASGTHQIFGNNTLGYYNAIVNNNYIELRHSYDGILWDSLVNVFDFRFTYNFFTSEACFQYLGNGTMLGLIRNESGIIGENFLQVESYDYGRTWTDPRLTNIANGFFCPSPWLFYDNTYNDIWVVACDRRGTLDLPLGHENEYVWVYKSSPDEVLGDPAGYKLFEMFLRPSPSFYRFYGYPSSTRKQNGDYLVLFTENDYRSTKGEVAYLYQFDILYNGPTQTALNEKSEKDFNAFPSPFTSSLTVTGSCPEPDQHDNIVKLRLVNSMGETVLQKTSDKRSDDSFLFVSNDLSIPAGIYFCIVECGTYKSEKKIVKL